MTKLTNEKRSRRMAREPKSEAITEQGNAGTGTAPSEQSAAPAPAKKPTKTEKVLSLLRRADGATLNELVEATDWLPHTTRAALTGLKKKGHKIERTKVDGASRYAIVEAAPK